MQLATIKISNLLSFPFEPDLSKIEGIKFFAQEQKDVNILIGPNGAGKSWFLHIISQFFRTGLMNDYIYTKQYIDEKSPLLKNSITLHQQAIQGIRPHFASGDKPSQLSLQLILTEHDYDNLQYISKHRDIFTLLIQKYSSLSIQYPAFSHEQIHDIPSIFTLDCRVDFSTQRFVIDDKKLSAQHKFVLMYFQTLELLQICIDIYNEFERSGKQLPLLPLKNGVAFISSNRTLAHLPSAVDPHTRNTLIWNKNTSDHHAHIGFYLCVKKIRNIISDHFTLSMTKKDIANYPQRLEQSEFYVSLQFIIKKYLNKRLYVEYANGLLTLHLIDNFGNIIPFSQLSDGEQSLLSMIFTMYGYDLKHGMVMIDEPEIHFHPQMQRSFARMIEKISQNIGTQFVVSTYSPLFINESNIANVYRFSKIDGKTTVKNPLFTLSSDEATLVHLLKFENLSKIFFVNKIIMVEGETDAYFFEFYLKYIHTLPERKDKITDYEIININGKWSYKVRNKFLSRFGLQSFFIGDRDNIVDYGFMTQEDLWYYYKQARSQYAGLKKSWKTHRHYNKLVDTIRNLFPQKYKYLIASIDKLYAKHICILKKWDIETYLGMSEKWLENTVKFCHHEFAQWLKNKNFDTCRQEFAEILHTIFST